MNFLTIFGITISTRYQINLIGECVIEQNYIFRWSDALSPFPDSVELQNMSIIQVWSVKVGYHAWTKILQMFNIIFFKMCWAFSHIFQCSCFFKFSHAKFCVPRVVIMLLKDCLHLFHLFLSLMIAAISHIFQCENFFELLLQNAYIILKFVRMTGIITKKLAINVRKYESKLHELNWEAKINKIWNKGNGNNISKYHQVW